jgi:curli biogenesis system outer membrane secretion channel CsgG
MKKSPIFLLLIILSVLLVFNFAIAQVIPPKARGTPSSGPTIDQAQSEDAMGPKARVAVTKFIDKSAKGRSYGAIGDGMAEMLANALFATNRFIVLERQSLKDVMREQDLGASGRVRQETAAPIGEIEGADLLIEGTITEFEPGTAGAAGGVGGIIPLPGPGGRVVRGIGGIAGGIKTSHVAMIVKVIDARTGRRLASEQVEGKATDIGGVTGMGGGGLAGVFGGYSKTPMEKAIRVTIEESVRLIVAKTPAEYYRASATPQPQAPPPAATATPTPSPPAMKAPQTTKAPGQEPRIVSVKWPTVSLREGPGMNFKTLVEVKKGTTLAVLEEQGQWLRVSLEDGREGWIGKATISETP